MAGFSERWIAERWGLNRAELRRFCKRFELPESSRKKVVGGFTEALENLKSVRIEVGGRVFVMGWSLVEPLMGRPVNWAELEQVEQLTKLAMIGHRKAMGVRGIPLEEKAKEWAETMRDVEEGK